jgi:hypothetical protein
VDKMLDIAKSLQEFGAELAKLYLLGDDGPELLPYSTLLNARRERDSVLNVVEAVYEWQEAPLIYIVSADTISSDSQLQRVRRLLAMRGDAPYLGVLRPGRLDVFRIALDSKSLAQAQVDTNKGKTSEIATLAYLANLRPQAAIAQRDWISSVVLKLLTSSIDQLITDSKIRDEDAISLVGRALFTRFLADRNLLPEGMTHARPAEILFDGRVNAEQTSQWLDETFNGDLLPLSAGIFDDLPDAAYHVLGGVLRRAPDHQLFLGWEEDWLNLNFAHIPVGVLSQAYELYLRNHASTQQRKEGGYYTPRLIADLMVRASFRALDRDGVSARAKVLDPAAGAGVFLLVALRELVRARWVSDGKRPNTETLRSILYEQIAGFDVNEAALRFAALGLYLMSIELDPEPRPVDKLRFENLRGRVLHKFRTNDEVEGAALGSLGPLVQAEHRHRYDLVIGNPPWSSGTKLKNWQLVCSTVARIASERTGSNVNPPLPNEGLDLPFVWRAMEWTKSHGQIAFALHARLLFQQGDGMQEARRAIFQSLDITSIINGAELRQTRVWPEITAPFCIVFATNRVPAPGSGFRFISPRLEQGLNASGSMRIDSSNAELVPFEKVSESCDILKILFRGSHADLGIMERIRAQGYLTLKEFWRDAGRDAGRDPRRTSGNGYQKLRQSSHAKKDRDGLSGKTANHLRDLPDVTVRSLSDLAIQVKTLTPFHADRVHRSRTAELFKPHLVIVHKSPPAERGRITVAISEEAVVFNESFYGYSAYKLANEAILVRYLALLLGSKLVLWMALITSGEFGFEREVIEKETLGRIVLPDFREFTPVQHAEISSLFDGLLSGQHDWSAVDTWALKLYALGPRDLQVISDTLEFNLPFAENRRRAQEPPTESDQKAFRDVIEDELRPWCERFGAVLTFEEGPDLALSPWKCFCLRVLSSGKRELISPDEWQGLLHVADETAATEVLFRMGVDALLIGKLGQKRYWSATQARLLAQRIIWSHVSFLQGRGEA